MLEAEIVEKAELIHQYHMDIADFYDEYTKHFGITLSTAKVLGVMLKNKNCTQKDIIQRTYLPKQTVSAIIKSLETQEVVIQTTNSKEDKRNKIIKYTPNGKKWATNIMKEMEKVIIHSLQSLGEEKVLTLVSIFKEFRDNIQEYKNNIKNKG